MIEIVFEPKRLSLTLRGHAGAGMPGQDLICCAASILTYTLAANVRQMQKKGWLRSGAIRLSPGDAAIACTPAKLYREQAEARFECLCLGFRLLARDYPEFVSFREE